tara:strand:+ start:256 stop:366 length:111 start_codon:yes stop_codon:yes gene_type:complete
MRFGLNIRNRFDVMWPRLPGQIAASAVNRIMAGERP